MSSASCSRPATTVTPARRAPSICAISSCVKSTVSLRTWSLACSRQRTKRCSMECSELHAMLWLMISSCMPA
jgi:hypothetical protein